MKAPSVKKKFQYLKLLLNPIENGFERVNVSNAKKQKVPGKCYDPSTKKRKIKQSYFDLEGKPKPIEYFSFNSSYLAKKLELINIKRDFNISIKDLIIIEDFFGKYQAKTKARRKVLLISVKTDLETFKKIFDFYYDHNKQWEFVRTKYCSFVTSGWPESQQRARFNNAGKILNNKNKITPQMKKVRLSLKNKQDTSSFIQLIDENYPGLIDETIKNVFWPPEQLKRYLENPEEYSRIKKIATDSKGHSNWYYNEWVNELSLAPDRKINFINRHDEIEQINPKTFCENKAAEINKNHLKLENIFKGVEL